MGIAMSEWPSNPHNLEEGVIFYGHTNLNLSHKQSTH